MKFVPIICIYCGSLKLQQIKMNITQSFSDITEQTFFRQAIFCFLHILTAGSLDSKQTAIRSYFENKVVKNLEPDIVSTHHTNFIHPLWDKRLMRRNFITIIKCEATNWHTKRMISINQNKQKQHLSCSNVSRQSCPFLGDTNSK